MDYSAHARITVTNVSTTQEGHVDDGPGEVGIPKGCVKTDSPGHSRQQRQRPPRQRRQEGWGMDCGAHARISVTNVSTTHEGHANNEPGEVGAPKGGIQRVEWGRRHRRRLGRAVDGDAIDGLLNLQVRTPREQAPQTQAPPP
jgi:hypothetical protein